MRAVIKYDEAIYGSLNEGTSNSLDLGQQVSKGTEIPVDMSLIFCRGPALQPLR